MASQGPRFPGTGADDASVGTVSWNSATAVTAEDTVNAFRAHLNSQVTHYLKATNFGFSIPAGATIRGITVEIKRMRTSAGGTNQDSAVRIVKGGSIGATNKASAAVWPLNVLTYASYGSASDLWGENWTAADINASNFGAVLSGINPSATNTNSSVDAIRITVTYSVTVTGAAGLSGQGSIAGAGFRTAIAAAAISGQCSISAAGERETFAEAGVAGTGTIEAAGVVTPPPPQDSPSAGPWFISPISLDSLSLEPGLDLQQPELPSSIDLSR